MSHSAVDARALDSLTRDPRKAEAYRHDPYMREALASLAPALGTDALHRHTFVVLKPDAVAGRRCAPVLGILRDLGWHPVAATTVRFDPLLVRELWRYQFNAASAQRIALVDPLLSSGPSLLVLLEDRGTDRELPASVRLTAAKGSAEPSAARSGDLRTRVGRVNGLLNFMHTADEPADVARELQLFSYQTGWAWCAGPLLGTAPPTRPPPRRPCARCCAPPRPRSPPTTCGSTRASTGWPRWTGRGARGPARRRTRRGSRSGSACSAGPRSRTATPAGTCSPC